MGAVTLAKLLAACAAGLLVLGCTPPRGDAQRAWRVGYLSGNFRPSSNIEILVEVLREHDYVVGRNLVIESRFTEGKVDDLPSAAAELMQLPLDILVADATPAARVAKEVAGDRPVVFVRVNDPVGQGLVASLGHPGGNVTGVSTLSAALSGKRVELLREVAPRLTRLAVFWNASNPGQESVLGETEDAARLVGIQIASLPIHSNADLQAAVQAADAQRPDAVLILAAFIWDARSIAELADRRRVPLVTSERNLAASTGALMSLGPDYPSLHRRAAEQVVKILRGARPADLPVEQPTRFELTANQGTARNLGIDLPASVVAQVTEWIE